MSSNLRAMVSSSAITAYGKSYVRDTSSGTMTAQIDPIEAALATQAVQTGTQAMQGQYQAFLSIFSSLA